MVLNMFQSDKDTFSKREEKILTLWREQEFFRKSLDKRRGSPVFSFYDGPPFATGLPHYGHLLAGTIKDIIPRYKTMKGFYVPRRFGWDCHGLPVENEIEKAKNLAGAPEIEQFGIAAFNEECRSIVQRFANEWKTSVQRMGRWVDFDNSYKTMDKNFMESVWWVFGQIFEKGLVYQGYKVMPFSAKLGTPLSNFEANSNYKDVQDPSLTVKINLEAEEKTSILIWTTTPWTLPMNLFVAVSKEISYVKIQVGEEKYILAKSRLSAYFEEGSYQVLDTFSGEKLEGVKYEPLFDYFKDKKAEGAFQIVLEESLSGDDGTGAMHVAPAFGEVDFFIGQRASVEPVCPVDQNGKYTKQIPEYKGLFVKDADKDIIKRLKEKGAIFKHSQLSHRYPFCYRSDTPLIYKAVSTWFIAVEKIKDKVLASNDQINWVPDHIKSGRFGKWLENARDWAVSRNRYWGTPIPIWRNEDGDIIVISSIEELEKRTGKTFDDLHRHFIDQVTFEEGGKSYKRVPEVFDCWFESGSMPYAQKHYPFENSKEFEDSFPADFIAEGLDQTRGWFYTLTVLSSALFDRPAFKNAIVNGIVLAEDGQKMSKRLKNYPDPVHVINQFGADAVRLYLIHSPVVHAEDLRFQEKGVETTLRQILLPLWNSYSFLATYANIYNWKPKNNFQKPQADIDRWLMSCLQKLIGDVETALDEYNLSKAVGPFVDFIDKLTNWYIRRSRSRFWSDVQTQDRDEAFETLYTVIKNLTKVLAPFIPFLSEAIYQELKLDSEENSVHLTDYPKVDVMFVDEHLELQMEYSQKVVSLGHSLRKEAKIKVRQPLQAATVVTNDHEAAEALKKQKDLICEELNVKTLEFCQDETQFVNLTILPNYPTLGKRAGKYMKDIKNCLATLSSHDLDQLDASGKITLQLKDHNFEITKDEVIVRREAKEGLVAKTFESLTILLDTNLRPELIQEGLAREIINKINTMRKNEGFEITDRIEVTISSEESVEKAYNLHKHYIEKEILAKQTIFQSTDGTSWDLNGHEAIISLRKL